MTATLFRKIDAWRWEIPRTGGMRVPGLLYTSEKLMKGMGGDEGPQQVANVAHLPGIVKASLAMPDMHWGYGFPIGGVAAFDMDEGVVSPGGVGYDINCGCRLVTTRLRHEEIRDRMRGLVAALFQHIPSGVGSRGPLKLSPKEERQAMVDGAAWAVRQGYGEAADLETTEDGGTMAGADPATVSERALERGKDQLGTLGSGNHFLEVEVVEELFDEKTAAAFGLFPDQICVLIHTGSRGFGYQVCDDYLVRMVKHLDEIGPLPDRQLACARLNSARGQEYLAAMACAANYAWANRQILMHRTREVFERTLGKGPRQLGMRLLYDVCHNIAKVEKLPVDGEETRLCVHRKGATRAFPPGHPSVPQAYRTVGQPVLIPGDMGTGSYVLAGTEQAFQESFGSTCHGAGRVMSRKRAVKASRGRSILKEMEARGVIVMSPAKGTLMEEIPEAYKKLDDVIEVVQGAGLSRRVARLRAVGCIKG
ncbi:MAG: RtcB family protein [Deltaproteobacteria bacterium]|nr:RtcB family protein [Deltaproteobacteria bacterium]